MTSLSRLILDRIHAQGPITFAAFMELALYHPDLGYYATAGRRSGRSGDFYTSVDVSPLFGEMLSEQIAEMARVIGPAPFDLVEAGAGNGRLSRDVLDALQARAPDVYDRVRLHLVERSAAARAAQAEVLAPHASKLASSAADVPSRINGIVFANELLDALPTHVVVGRDEGLREVFVDAHGDELIEREMAPSTPEIERYLERAGVRLRPGWRGEVNMDAIEWMRRIAGALERGFLMLVDYGHEAANLYSASHAEGTLASFTAHVVETHEPGGRAAWLRDPGSSDITAHVDFTSVRRAAEAEGMTTICLVDQMHFLLGLGIDRHVADEGPGRDEMMRRLALKTLLVPGGLGTSHQVLIMGKDVGRPALRGCAKSSTS